MSQGAAKGAAIANLWVGDKRDRLVQERRLLSDERLGSQATLAGHGADRQPSRRARSHEVQIAQPIEVNQNKWAGEAEVEQGDQTLSTREQLGVVAMFPHRRQGGFESIRSGVVERCRFHTVFLSLVIGSLSASSVLAGEECANSEALLHHLDLDPLELCRS